MTDSLTEFSISLSPYLLIIGLASASFAAGTSTELALVTAMLSSTVYFIVLKVFTDSRKYIYGAFLGYTQLLVYVLYTEISLDFLLLFKMFSMAFIATIIPLLAFTLIEPFKLKIAYPVYAHFLDASSTVLALDSGLREKVYLAQMFIRNFGMYGVFLMKFLIIGPLAYYLVNNYEKDLERKVFFLVTIYGIVLSFRNYFLILLTGVS